MSKLDIICKQLKDIEEMMATNVQVKHHLDQFGSIKKRFIDIKTIFDETTDIVSKVMDDLNFQIKVLDVTWKLISTEVEFSRIQWLFDGSYFYMLKFVNQ